LSGNQIGGVGIGSEEDDWKVAFDSAQDNSSISGEKVDGPHRSEVHCA
jgi:hypothetical protein